MSVGGRFPSLYNPSPCSDGGIGDRAQGNVRFRLRVTGAGPLLVLLKVLRPYLNGTLRTIPNTFVDRAVNPAQQPGEQLN